MHLIFFEIDKIHTWGLIPVDDNISWLTKMLRKTITIFQEMLPQTLRISWISLGDYGYYGCPLTAKTVRYPRTQSKWYYCSTIIICHLVSNKTYCSALLLSIIMCSCVMVAFQYLRTLRLTTSYPPDYDQANKLILAFVFVLRSKAF